jgi:hypothetical protein
VYDNVLFSGGLWRFEGTFCLQPQSQDVQDGGPLRPSKGERTVFFMILETSHSTTQCQIFSFHSRTMHLDIIKVFTPTDAQVFF